MSKTTITITSELVERTMGAIKTRLTKRLMAEAEAQAERIKQEFIAEAMHLIDTLQYDFDQVRSFSAPEINYVLNVIMPKESK